MSRPGRATSSLPPGAMSRRLFLALTAGAAGCGGKTSPTAPSTTTGRLTARPQAQRTTLSPGAHQMTGANGISDGIIYVPRDADPARPLPFAVMLHGGGGNELTMQFTLPLADEFGVALLVPNSRARTWDAVIGPFGADAAFIDKALAQAFASCAVDPARVTVGGLSDGATYALALGLLNGDLFTRIVAFSGGFLKPVDRYGKPRVFVSHGRYDAVLSIDIGGRAIVRQLLAEGYDVTYREFDGGHWVPDDIAIEAFAWLSAS
jgi:phospholipase/carboxylesterase